MHFFAVKNTFTRMDLDTINKNFITLRRYAKSVCVVFITKLTDDCYTKKMHFRHISAGEFNDHTFNKEDNIINFMGQQIFAWFH